MSQLNKLDGKTFDVVQHNIEQLKQLFPEVFTENKIMWDRLQQVLGEHIETEKERYEFTWNGKTEAIQLAQKQSTGTLRPCKEESVNWDTTQNLYIEGDNLEVLRLLQNSYRNKIKMIYIDPPYNTGNDFIYKDNFSSNIQMYKERLQEQYKSNVNTSGRYHTDWLNMIYSRLVVAKNLLHDEGIIYISIDDHEYANLRKVCDEIFGEYCYKGSIVRATGQTTGQDSGGLGSSFDYILVYTKTPDIELDGLPLTQEDLKRFENIDERGNFAYDQMRKTGSNDRREDRPNMFYPIENPDGELVYPIAPAGYESCWRFEKKTYERLVEEGYIYWKKSKRENEEIWWPYVKYYAEGRTKRPSPLWDDLEGNKKASRDLRDLFDGKKVFSHPKPIPMIERLIQITPSSTNQDIILDFFGGSGTTGHAVMNINNSLNTNKRFIIVQLPEEISSHTEAYKKGYYNISDLCKERLRKAGKLYKDNFTLDIGFKVFKLDETNLKAWDEYADDLERSLFDATTPVKEGRTQEDVVYEILLKYGIDLTVPIEEKEIAGTKVFSIGLGYLFVCLDLNVSLAQIEEIAKEKPSRIVFYDDSFATDVVRTNAQQILKRYGVEDIRVI